MKTLRILALLSLFVATPLAAAPTVSLTPANVGVAPATQLDLRVFVNSEMPALGCYSFSVTYDPAVLDLTGASEGVTFSGAIEPTFFGTGFDGLGRTQVSGCVLGFGTSIATPAEVAVLHFDVLAEGTTSVDLVDGVMRDIARAEVSGVVYEGAAVVVGTTGVGSIDSGTGSLLVSPNPSASVVQLALRDGGDAVYDRLEIYDAAGRRVRSLPWGLDVAGSQWNGRDDDGREVSAGLYFAVLRGGTTPPLRAKLLRIR